VELRHLNYFVAVAEEGSFTRAAERLWIAQPGLSQQILALERELGVKLLERRSRGAVPTDAGRAFLDKARAVLRAADDALAVATQSAAGLTGTLRVGMSWRARYDVAPDLVHEFVSSRPGVDVTGVEAETDTLIRDVRDQRLDAAIVFGQAERLPGFDSFPLSNGPVGVVMAAGHPLAGRSRLVARDLRTRVVVISGGSAGSTYDRWVGDALRWLGVEATLLPGGYGLAMLSPVRAGEALMLDGVPSLADADNTVVWRPLEPAPTYRFDLIWRSGARSGPLDAFIEASARQVTRRAHAELSEGAA
jgi:DNA-binding transcriptional LysR family regulator